MSDALDEAMAATEEALGEHLEGMVLAFALVVERVLDDGQTVLSVLHTSMTPWHLTGMLTYAHDEVHVKLEDVDEDFTD